MWLAFESMSTNVGMTLENILLFIVIVGGIIFYARDFKIGIAIQFIFSGLLFMFFYQNGLNWVPSLVVFLVTLVIMAFNLYAIVQTQSTGELV